MVKAKKFVFVKNFEDFPRENDFKLEEEELPKLQEGEYLAEAVFLSVDPYMRAYAHRLPSGVVMIGSQVARITESKNASFPVGKFIVGSFGWRTHTIVDPLKHSPGSSTPYILPNFGHFPVSLGLGMLGMTGNAALYGLIDICKPVRGETIVITAAAGAVGSHVGQIAKLKGCKIIGLTGSDEKCKWLISLKFDHAINYKTANLKKALAEAAPRGIDCFFDNVGGELSSQIMQSMNKFGRIAVCGCISSYNNDVKNLPKATIIQPSMVFQQLEMKGFVVDQWKEKWFEGIRQNLQWLNNGKIQYHETITEGFENMFVAFEGMLKGENTGKAIVKL